MLPVQRSGLLIDAREYYRAFYRTARLARRYIVLAGWKFNSDIRLLRGKDAKEAGEEVQFLPFLKKLCDENPELHVYVLAWNFSLMYVLQWEKNLKQTFEKAHPRIHFCFDGHHPFGGSHHQKFAVIDGHTAFIGGLDFNADDWDDRNHHADNPQRQDSGDAQHGPYHDVQGCLLGEAAQEVARYFAKRWTTATGESIELPPPENTPVAEGCPGHKLACTDVAFSRHEVGVVPSEKDVFEILQLYIDAFASAERLIYIENQYFSSWAIGEALETRLRDASKPKLDIVILLPKYTNSVLEATVMEPAKLHRIESLRRVAKETGHRLGIYYSAASADGCVEVPSLIHSKLMIVDDRFFTVGSANLSNRSMGLDSELNVSWEATAEENDLQDAIRKIRINLLEEHTGLCGSDEKPKGLERQTGLVELLDSLAESQDSKLRILTSDKIVGNRIWLRILERFGVFLDPDEPLIGRGHRPRHWIRRSRAYPEVIKPTNGAPEVPSEVRNGNSAQGDSETSLTSEMRTSVLASTGSPEAER